VPKSADDVKRVLQKLNRPNENRWSKVFKDWQFNGRNQVRTELQQAMSSGG
jgi:hypothetical protein